MEGAWKSGQLRDKRRKRFSFVVIDIIFITLS